MAKNYPDATSQSHFRGGNMVTTPSVNEEERKFTVPRGPVPAKMAAQRKQ